MPPSTIIIFPNLINNLFKLTLGPAFPIAIITLPQFGSSPATAVFTKGEFATEKAIFFASISFLHLLTFIVINLEKYNKVKKTIKDYQKFIKDNFKYVGDNFAYEARSIHYNGKKKSKGIYGSASKKDLKELKEEGIDAQIIPWIDEKEN